MRERVEDLGRIYERVTELMDDDFFRMNIKSPRAKDAVMWFNGLSKDEQEDTIRSIAYGIERVFEKLGEIVDIAAAEDRLNYEGDDKF